MRWYNELRRTVNPESPQLIESENQDALCVILISNGRFFEQVIETYRADPGSIPNNFVERTTNRLLNELVRNLKIKGCKQVSQYNLDTPPFLHSQSLGYLAGLVEYISGDEVIVHDDERVLLEQRCHHNRFTNADSRMLGLTLHPQYGGWFAYRGLLVLHDLNWPDERSKPSPMKFLSERQRRDAILQFNLDPDIGYWRDLNDPRRGPVIRYTVVQYAYFHEKSIARRRRMLQLLDEEQIRSRFP